MLIAVIDYGSGNLKSAAKALEVAASNINKSFKIVVTSDPKIIKQSDKIVLPGQGSFRDCYLGIKRISGLDETLNEFVLEKKKPILGICVGMQLFAKTGYESQETKGFGWIDAEVRKINNMNKKLKLPHMGWNEIELKKNCFIFSNIKNKSHVYFIHSYEFMVKQKDCVVATTNYGNSIIVSVEKENIIGTQFHPEKSQKNGLIILENFLKWKL
ncbi:MAG TPA: imidazole glycerol phosphate synthase subunit HisH [Candidatus Pelagibacter sp.]|jgi:glutamine amidotransferase|nr:imidazole glycerol phosphate synthase subunit HisH [Candidatus Pelagibacter sp.]